MLVHFATEKGRFTQVARRASAGNAESLALAARRATCGERLRERHERLDAGCILRSCVRCSYAQVHQTGLPVSQ